MLALSNVSVISKDPSTERTVRGTGSDVAKASHKGPTSTAQRIRAIGVWCLLVMHNFGGFVAHPHSDMELKFKKMSQICRMCFHFWRGGSKEMIEMPHFLTRYSVKLWSRATSTIHVGPPWTPWWPQGASATFLAAFRQSSPRLVMFKHLKHRMRTN